MIEATSRPAVVGRVPLRFRSALVLGAGFFAFVAWDQSYWWRTTVDYGFGWLVPVFVVYIVHQRWPRILTALRDCADGDSPRAAGWHQAVVVAGAGACLAWGAFWFLLGSFYRASVGPSLLGTLAITMGAACTMSALLFFSAPFSAQPKPTSAFKDPRLRVVLLFLFPLAVWLISAPLVSVVESAVNRLLLNHVVSVIRTFFGVLGLPIAQHGNVLLLPTGEVGVAEACSGIRSLTGCLFAGAFLAAAWLDQWWRKALLFALGFPLAVFSNLVRTLFLTSWAYRYGAGAIEGTLHDLTGYAVLGLATLLLILAAHLLARR